MANRLPGKGWLGWLGRQVGYVRKAVHTDPLPPPKVIHRENRVEEKELPSQPGVKFRRTVIDEVIVEKRIEKPVFDPAQTPGAARSQQPEGIQDQSKHPPESSQPPTPSAAFLILASGFWLLASSSLASHFLIA